MSWTTSVWLTIHAWVGAIVRAIKAMPAKDAGTLIIALYGALLSTIVFIQTRRRERRKIKIEAIPSFLRYGDGSFSSELTEIVVVNLGHRTVVVSAPCIQLPNKKYINFADADGLHDFPKRLEDGEKASIRMTNKKIAKAILSAGYTKVTKVRPSCRDSAGTQYLGPKWEVDPKLS